MRHDNGHQQPFHFSSVQFAHTHRDRFQRARNQVNGKRGRERERAHTLTKYKVLYVSQKNEKEGNPKPKHESMHTQQSETNEEVEQKKTSKRHHIKYTFT